MIWQAHSNSFAHDYWLIDHYFEIHSRLLDQIFNPDAQTWLTIFLDKTQEFKWYFQNWPLLSKLPQKVFTKSECCSPYKLDLVQTIFSQVGNYNFNDISHYYIVIKFVTRF